MKPRRKFDLKKAKFDCIHTISGHKGPIHRLRFDPLTHSYCVTGAEDSNIMLWNFEKGTHVKTFEGHSHPICDVEISFDNARILSGSKDKNAFLWDIATGKLLQKYYEPTQGTVFCVKFFQDSFCSLDGATKNGANDKIILTGSYDKAIRIWDVRVPKDVENTSIYFRKQYPVQVFKDSFKDSVYSIDVFCAQSLVVGASLDGTVRIFDLRQGKGFIDEMKHPVTDVSFCKGGKFLLSNVLDNKMKLSDPSNGEILNTFTLPNTFKNDNFALKHGLSTGEDFVVCGSEVFDDANKCFDLVGWDILAPSPEMKKKNEKEKAGVNPAPEIDENNVWVFPTGHLGPISSVCFKPRELAFATSSFDGTIKFWKNEGDAV